ncbi:MAG TPA: ABC transporter ATP-binding protein [Lentisphaeria bacterium]|nr:ABC transporter ATP-binding protein [Lentisphaeria bacterium]
MTPSTSEPVVEAVELSKVFLDFWRRPKAVAVSKIDFSLHQGQVLGFLGPNGSGKSTTIKMMLGLLRPTGGSLRVLGESPRNVPVKRRIGYLPEETHLYKYLTARETLDFMGSLFKLPKRERAKRIDQLLEMVGLEQSADRIVGEFSKGMARRVGLAQALINDPDLVILDEPTSGLDPLGCQEVREIIKALKKKGTTVVLCSHLLSDVEDVCDDVMIMYGGKIRASGSLDVLLADQTHTQIVTEALGESALQQIRETLDRLGAKSVAVSAPNKGLTEFFLDVMNQARQDQLATAGSATGKGVADYLTDEQGADEDVLEKLLQDDQLPVPDVAANTAPEPETTAPDLAQLEALSPEQLPSEKAAPSVDRHVESDRIRSLLDDD